MRLGKRLRERDLGEKNLEAWDKLTQEGEALRKSTEKLVEKALNGHKNDLLKREK